MEMIFKNRKVQEPYEFGGLLNDAQLNGKTLVGIPLVASSYTVHPASGLIVYQTDVKFDLDPGYYLKIYPVDDIAKRALLFPQNTRMIHRDDLKNNYISLNFSKGDNFNWDNKYHKGDIIAQAIIKKDKMYDTEMKLSVEDLEENTLDDMVRKDKTYKQHLAKLLQEEMTKRNENGMKLSVEDE